jgi:PAS domain S-box-containing protein
VHGAGPVAKLQLFSDLSAETVEHMPLGFVALDANLLVTYANPVALGLIGTTAAELVGRRPWDLFPEIVGTRSQTVRVSFPVAVAYEHQIGLREPWVGVLACPTQTRTAVFLRDITEKKRAEETVRRLVALLHGSLDAILDAVLLCSAVRDDDDAIVDFRVDFANSVAGEFLGRPPDALIGALLPDWAPVLQGRSFVETCRTVVETGEPHVEGSVTYAIPHSAGMSAVGALSIQILRFNDGFFATWRDVTKSEAIRRERELLAGVLEQIVDGVVIINPQGIVTYANPAFRATNNLTVDAVVGHRAAEIAGELFGLDGFGRIEQAALAGRPWLQSIERPGVDGTRQLEVSMTPVLDADATVVSYVVLARDVTELREAENEVALDLRVRTALAESVQKVALDSSLEEAAQAICDELVKLPFVGAAAVEAFLGPVDVQVIARSAPAGYPELEDLHLPPERAALVRERAAAGPWAEYEDSDPAAYWIGQSPSGLRATAHGPIVHGDHVAGVLVIGTFEARFARTLVEKMPGIMLFSAASSALLAERLHSRHRSAELHVALSALLEARAFHPVFQPIVDLATTEVVGYESLTRFDSGQRPDLCFADAWSVGLGRELELATLEAAVAASKGLPAGTWLDVNISPSLLGDAERLKAVLRSAERPVVIEITEHEIIADYDAIRAAIRALGKDIRVAVDDAGAGVANFGHIIDMRPDFVKLDIGLVRRVNGHLGRQAMVVGMRHFSRTAGCRLVAEGIETPEEANTLKGLGVEFGQGYLFAHPVPIDKLAQEERRARRKWTAELAAA